MKYVLIILLSIFNSACGNGVEVTPDKLPNAYLNEPYSTEVNINGGTVIDINFNQHTSNPEFKVKPTLNSRGYDDYNMLVIKGTPTNTETIHVFISGSLYGTMLSSGENFEKEYTIKVKER